MNQELGSVRCNQSFDLPKDLLQAIESASRASCKRTNPFIGTVCLYNQKRTKKVYQTNQILTIDENALNILSSQISKTNETKHMTPVSTTNEPKLTLPSLSTKSSIGLKRQAHFDYTCQSYACLLSCFAIPQSEQWRHSNSSCW